MGKSKGIDAFRNTPDESSNRRAIVSYFPSSVANPRRKSEAPARRNRSGHWLRPDGSDEGAALRQGKLESSSRIRRPSAPNVLGRLYTGRRCSTAIFK